MLGLSLIKKFKDIYTSIKKKIKHFFFEQGSSVEKLELNNKKTSDILKMKDVLKIDDKKKSSKVVKMKDVLKMDSKKKSSKVAKVTDILKISGKKLNKATKMKDILEVNNNQKLSKIVTTKDIFGVDACTNTVFINLYFLETDTTWSKSALLTQKNLIHLINYNYNIKENIRYKFNIKGLKYPAYCTFKMKLVKNEKISLDHSYDKENHGRHIVIPTPFELSWKGVWVKSKHGLVTKLCYILEDLSEYYSEIDTFTEIAYIKVKWIHIKNIKKRILDYHE